MDTQSPQRRRWSIATVAAAAGLAAGVTLGGLGIANAATSGSSASSGSSSSSSTSPTSPASPAYGGGAPPGTAPSAPGGAPPGGAYHGLPLSGTVSAVGTDSVTIKTSTATTTYAVTSSSDIDKNGEATLSDLAPGDAVTFSTTTSGTTASIDKLHAGSEALDRPTGPPDGMGGNPPAGAQAPSGAGTTAA